EWQLRVAAGEELPKKQEELSINGWAMEARLYAEDPAKGFLPSVGRLETLNIAKRDLRTETGVDVGDIISPFYDPMIAKSIAHGADRAEALFKLSCGIEGFETWPVSTNAGFLLRCLANEDFRQGRLSTGLITEHLEALSSPSETGRQSMLDDAATGLIASELSNIVSVYGTLRDEIESKFGRTPWMHAVNFRMNAPAKDLVTMIVAGETLRRRLPANYLDRYISVEPAEGGLVVFDQGEALFVTTRVEGAGRHSAHDGDILSPMPGKIIAVEVAAGDAVTKGQKLLTLEAMKMEHTLTAPFDGVVAELSAVPGAQVQVEVLLARIEAAE
ncbi:MAG: biotin/lipoyl-containing protein, partial [Novosphingobium sp.]|uniref:biotin/lipoyl-containing protein n=1 Tax=Novosphingobium sp. TaxID=1874826 RepID=UPI0032B7EA61